MTNVSAPEFLYRIFFQEEIVQNSLASVSILIEKMRSDFTKIRLDHIKSQERLCTMLNEQIQHFKHKKQPRTVAGSDLSLTKYTCFNFALNTIKVTKYVSYDIDPDTSCLNNHAQFVTILSIDLEPDIPITKPRNIFISDDLYPDIFKLEHIIYSDEVDEDGISKLTKSTTITSKSKL